MGCKPVPPYANIFMATIDAMMQNKKGAESILLLKRFLDDYFTIFKGSTKKLHAFFVKLNEIHPTIKFTMNHTNIRDEDLDQKCECEEKYTIPFLDVACTMEDGRIKTDLHTKETDRNMYLLPSSCHPKQTTKAIPFSLALRIVRVCSSPEERMSFVKAMSKVKGMS